MKYSDLADKTVAELNAMLKEKKTELFTLKIKQKIISHMKINVPTFKKTNYQNHLNLFRYLSLVVGMSDEKTRR